MILFVNPLDVEFSVIVGFDVFCFRPNSSSAVLSIASFYALTNIPPTSDSAADAMTYFKIPDIVKIAP